MGGVRNPGRVGVEWSGGSGLEAVWLKHALLRGGVSGPRGRVCMIRGGSGPRSGTPNPDQTIYPSC